jgi:hypothetical protein
MFAAGAIVLLARESGKLNDLGRFVVVLVPAVVLYLVALGDFERPRDAHARPWQSVLMVLAIPLSVLALAEFLRWVGLSNPSQLVLAAVFAVTALLAGFAAWQTRTAYCALLAGLALLLTWLALWSAVLHHPSADADRWLLIAAALLLLGAAGRLARAGAIGAGETATVGAISAVAAGVIGVILGAVSAAVHGITPILSQAASSRAVSSGALDSPHARTLPHPGVSPGLSIGHIGGLQHFGWDLYLLVVSAALIWIGARARVRGLGYVGGFGLLAFLVSVGAQITRLEAGHPSSSSIVGWPLALLVLGFAGLAAPALLARDDS